MPAKTIADVIQQLTQIIDWCSSRDHPAGYFACLYRRMTVAVQTAIAQNGFQNGTRMEQLDVIFANRYIDAWQAYQNNQPCSKAWKFAFDTCSNPRVVVFQHLLLGINTHINLDLCIAAAQTAPGDKIHDLEADFMAINQIIAAQSQQVQTILAKIWWPMRLLQKLSNKNEEAVLNFSMTTARKTSWANGVALATVSGQAHTNYISAIDNSVLKIAGRVVSPGFFLQWLLKAVKLTEGQQVKQNMLLLSH